ncbi:MAG: type II secretion system protein [Eubacteriales bacterium]|nr:type II secretion system protein [Eubacteriales bacterium]
MEKVRKITRKEDGFTLVELLAVIVILGIIVAIAIPAIGTVIDNAKIDAAAAEYDMVVDAGRLYFASNPDEAEVLVSTLMDGENPYIELRGGATELVYVGTTNKVTYSSNTYVLDLTRPTRTNSKVVGGKVTLNP